jgi:hypothetical protein
MKILAYILSFSFLFSACRKEEKKHSVVFKVIVKSGTPTYSVTYSSFNNTSSALGGIKESAWTSPSINDRKKGTVFLTLSGGSGGSYKMYIYVDGYLAMEDNMVDPYGPKTIEAVIRD